MKGSRDVRREEKNHWMSDGKGRGEGHLKEQCLHNECGQINHNRSIVNKNPHQQMHEKYK